MGGKGRLPIASATAAVTAHNAPVVLAFQGMCGRLQAWHVPVAVLISDETLPFSPRAMRACARHDAGVKRRSMSKWELLSACEICVRSCVFDGAQFPR